MFKPDCDGDVSPNASAYVRTKSFVNLIAWRMYHKSDTATSKHITPVVRTAHTPSESRTKNAVEFLGMTLKPSIRFLHLLADLNITIFMIYIIDSNGTLTLQGIPTGFDPTKVTSDKHLNLSNAKSMVLKVSCYANIIVLPECFNSPYGTSYFPTYAEPATKESPTFAALSNMAQQAGVYLFKESDVLTAGDGLSMVDTEYGKIGVGICYDIRSSEMAMMMAGKGLAWLWFTQEPSI
ncbi:hypothetical protein BSLG_005896 [Batrachochytrium salamandrivorans]|nr:hypothetical protein BSLG_005896 [Batrachochytrium salamandrivorans]